MIGNPPIINFSNGRELESFAICGCAVWLNMTKWKESPGLGKQPMDRISKRRWLENPLVPIRRTGEKNGSKRSVLVDEHGVPLSLVVSGANRHDSVSLDPLLKERAAAKEEDKEVIRNLCLDAGYVGKEGVVRNNGFIPHIRPRGEEKVLIERDSTFKARRWVVESAHSWFNRFRKLMPRYEKTDLSYLAFNMLAAAMITLNKVITIYG